MTHPPSHITLPSRELALDPLAAPHLGRSRQVYTPARRRTDYRALFEWMSKAWLSVPLVDDHVVREAAFRAGGAFSFFLTLT